MLRVGALLRQVQTLVLTQFVSVTLDWAAVPDANETALRQLLSAYGLHMQPVALGGSSVASRVSRVKGVHASSSQDAGPSASSTPAKGESDEKDQVNRPWAATRHGPGGGDGASAGQYPPYNPVIFTCLVDSRLRKLWDSRRSRTTPAIAPSMAVAPATGEVTELERESSGAVRYALGWPTRQLPWTGRDGTVQDVDLSATVRVQVVVATDGQSATVCLSVETLSFSVDNQKTTGTELVYFVDLVHLTAAVADLDCEAALVEAWPQETPAAGVVDHSIETRQPRLPGR